MAKRTTKKKVTKKPIESYNHKGKERANNPPVGLVTPDTDPDAGQKTTYEDDPHLDPRTIIEAIREPNAGITYHG